MEMLIVLVLSLLIDLSIGELPSQIHPVVWMGKCIDIIKKPLLKLGNRLSGVLLTIFLLLAFLSFFYLTIDLFINFNYFLYIVIAALLLSTTFSIKFLLESADLVRTDLDKSLEKARYSLAMLVSRNTSQLTSEEVSSATVESLTENLTDSVTAPIFYLAIFGILGAILQKTVFMGSMEESYHLPLILGLLAAVTYRVVNTLDAMVGYKNKINIDIGWFPAKADDYLNFFPARLTGVLVVIASSLMGLNWRKSWQIMIRDASNTSSPNSGYPMAAAAGALCVQLVKPGFYIIGDKTDSFNLEKITEALLLSKVTIILFLVLIMVTLVYMVLMR
jgi:adenosylcobinamide-phosphate synthase